MFAFEDGWARLPVDWRLGDVGGVAVDGDDRVYVFHRGAHPLLVFDRDGRLLDAWGDGVFTSPHGLHLGWDGCLYCTDDGDHTVRKFDLRGRLLLEIGVPRQPSPFLSGEPFNRCTHSALSPTGDIYVSDGYCNACVHCFGPDGRRRFSWGASGCLPGEFQVPHNLVCDAAGTVYVADRENHRVQVFDGHGGFLAAWHGVQRPMALAFEPAGASGPAGAASPAGATRLWVAEAGPTFNPRFTNLGPRVSLFDLGGRLIERFGDGGYGHAPDRFMAPHGIAVDSRGDLYVGEVAHAAWKMLHPGEPPPADLRTLRKLRRLREPQ